jgi:hypothetical protein
MNLGQPSSLDGAPGCKGSQEEAMEKDRKTVKRILVSAQLVAMLGAIGASTVVTAQAPPPLCEGLSCANDHDCGTQCSACNSVHKICLI